jgi:hypothetical protein
VSHNSRENVECREKCILECGSTFDCAKTGHQAPSLKNHHAVGFLIEKGFVGTDIGNSSGGK